MLTLSGTSGDMLKATQGFVSVEFSGVGPDTHTAPSGYLPREFKEAYTLRSTTGINQFGYSLHDGECLCISCVNISSTTHGPLCSRFRTQASFKPSRHRHHVTVIVVVTASPLYSLLHSSLQAAPPQQQSPPPY